LCREVNGHLHQQFSTHLYDLARLLHIVLAPFGPFHFPHMTHNVDSLFAIGRFALQVSTPIEAQVESAL